MSVVSGIVGDGAGGCFNDTNVTTSLFLRVAEQMLTEVAFVQEPPCARSAGDETVHRRDMVEDD